MRSLLHSVLFRAVCLAALACALQALSAQNVMAAKAGQPLVLVLPFQVNAGPEMPDASRDVPQLIVSQLEQNGLKAVPMNRARTLFERSGDNSIDLATAVAHSLRATRELRSKPAGTASPCSTGTRRVSMVKPSPN